MPYKEFQLFKKPANENVTIWRYMDFTKFTSLLTKKALYFCRADKLGDPFEGSMPKRNLQRRPELYKGKMSNKHIEGIGKFFALMPSQTFVNCWCKQSHESVALWRIYSSSNEGLAIRSTFRRLVDSFRDVPETVYIGEVHYIDYNKVSFSEQSTFNAFLHKWKSYDFEHEIRAVLTHDREAKELGKYVLVDLDRLIDKIVVSPTAPKWFSELVKAITAKYQLNKQVVTSTLAERPVY